MLFKLLMVLKLVPNRHHHTCVCVCTNHVTRFGSSVYTSRVSLERRWPRGRWVGILRGICWSVAHSFAHREHSFMGIARRLTESSHS
jgi:hypothetical protein